MDREVSELSVPVPWGEIRGQVWGPDHGRPVLCLHGWADNCGTFNTLIPLLPKGHLEYSDRNQDTVVSILVSFLVQSIDADMVRTVSVVVASGDRAECRYVAVDLAGHGRSSHRPPGVFYSVPAYVADVQRVIDALHLHKFSIIGHSMGADIAGMYSALYPEMVDALILLDGYGFLPTDLKEISKVMRQGMDEMIQFEKITEEERRVYTYEKAVERLLAVNPTLSEQSAHILLERGLVQVEGGFVFSRDLRVNFKNIVRISLEQSLEMQSRSQAPALVVLSQKGFDRIFSEPAQKKFTPTLLRCLQDRNHKVVTVPGNHHIHLNNPEVVAPFVSDFLRTKVLSSSTNREHKL